MAHAAGDALDFPIYGAHYRVVVPIFDADGDLVAGAADLDSEVSKDCGNWVDCTNESSEINSGGMYYLDLTGAEMSAKIVAVKVKTSTTGAKTTPLVLYPKRLPTLESGTAQGPGTGNNQIQLTAGASAKDDFYNGCFVLCTNNDPAGVQYQARRILDYTGSTTTATVESDWGTNPTSATTYSVLVPETVQVAGWAGKALAAWDTAGYPVITVKDGTGQGELNLASGVVDANMAQVSGDSTAADNLETMLDGTGGQTLSLKSLVINNSAGLAVDIDGTTAGVDISANNGPGLAVSSTGGNGSGITAAGHGSGDGMTLTGGATGDGLQAYGGASSGHGARLHGTGTGYSGLIADAAAGPGVYMQATSGNYAGLQIVGNGTEAGLRVAGGGTDGPGLVAVGGGSATNIDATTLAEMADALLVREFDQVTEPVDTRNLLNAARILRNKWTISGTALTVKKEDDATDAWTGTVTATAGASPITGNDPA